MSEMPSKRVRTSLAHARNRLSMVGAAAAVDEGGRRSRLGLVGQRRHHRRHASTTTNSPKRNSMPPGRNLLGVVVDFPRAGEHYRIKICFVGDRGCGKTKMME